MIKVVTLTMDWVEAHFVRPDFIKCDAEGAESWILEGGKGILSHSRPLLMIEVARKNADACHDILTSHRYNLYYAHAPIEASQSLNSLAETYEVIAIPSERANDYSGI